MRTKNYNSSKWPNFIFDNSTQLTSSCCHLLSFSYGKYEIIGRDNHFDPKYKYILKKSLVVIFIILDMFNTANIHITHPYHMYHSSIGIPALLTFEFPWLSLFILFTSKKRHILQNDYLNLLLRCVNFLYDFIVRW